MTHKTDEIDEAELIISTPHGPGRAVITAAAEPIATVVMSHGAGNGIDTADLEVLAAALPPQDITVVRFEQPWKVAGRKVATPPAILDAGLTAAVEELRPAGPLILGGRSAGARSAARTASTLGATGCLCLAFPLHPPGKPEKSRLEELDAAGVPVLVIQGEKDTMGRPDEFPERIEVVPVPAADHSLRVAKSAPITAEDVGAIVVESALEWITREVVGNETGARRR